MSFLLDQNPTREPHYPTLRIYKVLLKHYAIRLQKRFGQNFLIEPLLCKEIISFLNVQQNDIIWEIGPGLGALTFWLLRTPSHIKVFEIDHKFIKVLQQEFVPYYKHLKELHDLTGSFILEKGDVLKALPLCAQALPLKSKQPIKIVGNLPYNISAAILKTLIFYPVAQTMVFTIQKELFLRATASTSKENYTFLSVILQTFFDCKHLKNIEAQCFFPKPKVESCVVQFTPKNTDFINKKEFIGFVDALFRQKRKKLCNNWKIDPRLSKSTFETLPSYANYATKRPDAITPSEYGLLFQELSLHHPKILTLYNEKSPN